MEFAPMTTPFDEGCTTRVSWAKGGTIAAIVAAFVLIALSGMEMSRTAAGGVMSVAIAIGVFVLVLWMARVHRSCADRDAYLALIREGMTPVQAEVKMRQVRYARLAARHG